MESVVPENESGAETVAVSSEPVPLPTKRPESVVEPVPPTLTASVVDAETTPLLLVVSTPAGERDTVRFEVEAVPKYPVPETVSAVEEA